jgi:uncharacterized protein YkwD
MNWLNMVTNLFRKKKHKPAPVPTPVSNSVTVQAVLYLHNFFRQTHGLPLLVLNSKLTLSAQTHADDMAKHNSMSHTGSDGSTLSDRLHRVGYTYSGAGENIAMGYTDAVSLMQGLKSDAPHRNNILGPFHDVGIGINGTWYCVDFGATL